MFSFGFKLLASRFVALEAPSAFHDSFELYLRCIARSVV